MHVFGILKNQALATDVFLLVFILILIDEDAYYYHTNLVCKIHLTLLKLILRLQNIFLFLKRIE